MKRIPRVRIWCSQLTQNIHNWRVVFLIHRKCSILVCNNRNCRKMYFILESEHSLHLLEILAIDRRIYSPSEGGYSLFAWNIPHWLEYFLLAEILLTNECTPNHFKYTTYTITSCNAPACNANTPVQFHITQH